MKTKNAVIASSTLLVIAWIIFVLHGRPKPDETQEKKGSGASRHATATDPSSRQRSSRDASGSWEPYPLARLRSGKQFMSLLEKVFSIYDPEKRLLAIRGHLGMHVSDEVYQEALRRYGYRTDPMVLFDILAETWKAADPDAAEAWARLLPPGIASFSPEQFGEATIASFKPETSEDFEKLLAGGEAINQAKIIRAWAAKYPREAAVFATNSKIKALIDEAVATWAAADPDSALAWAKELNDEDARHQAMVAALSSWCLKHPGDPVDLTGLHEIMDGRAMAALLQGWTLHDPASAGSYALAIEDSNIRNSAVSQVADMWTMRNADQASAWADALPDKDLRETALIAISRKLAITDYDAARDVVLMIGDESTRTAEISGVIQQGLEQGQENALQLISRMRKVDSQDVTTWARSITDPAIVPAFREWFEKARSEGTIKAPAFISSGDSESQLDSVLRQLEQIEAHAQ